MDFFTVSGSGQQSVTGVMTVEDSNSYWTVRGTSGAVCHRGTPVKCGQNIRLTHVNTGRNLHSHYFTSPLSSNQVCTLVSVQAKLISNSNVNTFKIVFAFPGGQCIRRGR